jgi:hypothetical protein
LHRLPKQRVLLPVGIERAAEQPFGEPKAARRAFSQTAGDHAGFVEPPLVLYQVIDEAERLRQQVAE